MNGAEYTVQFLIDKGADTVFGYPGATVLSLYDAIARRPDAPRHILTRHEQGAVFAASGYAKASGRTGVCIATSGPGAVNLTTGIADAYLDSTPLLILTGQVDTASIGRDAFQEADIMGITIPITKHNYLVKRVEDLPRCLEEAWRIASDGRRGPVLVDIARNVFEADCPPLRDHASVILPRSRVNAYSLTGQIDQIREAVGSAYRPVLLAGGGVVSARASEKLSAFARASGIPVVTTLMGMGIVLDRTVNLYGMAGMYGSRAANAALAQSDLVIAVGTRFSDRTIGSFSHFARSRTIIHCDIDPAEISKNVTADIGVICGAGRFLDALLEAGAMPDPAAIAAWNASLRPLKSRHQITIHPDRLSGWEIMRLLDNAGQRRRDALYVSDVGDFQMAAARELEPLRERGFITSGGLGAMGFGLPAAIGASFAAPDDVRQILLLCGDGGFQMTLPELATLRQAPRPVKLFLFDNSALRMIVKMQDNRFEGRRFASSLADNPDFCQIAGAYGIPSVTIDVTRRDTLARDIDAVLDAPVSTLVHCRV